MQSLLALWLFQRFAFSLADAASFFFAASLLAGLSQLLSPRLARRYRPDPDDGLHAPARERVPRRGGVRAERARSPSRCLLVRMTLSQMDVPARQAFVMSVVPPEERAAAATVTNVPRSLGGSLSPLLGGWLLASTSFGWPLVIGGALKIVYDLLLLRGYRSHEASMPNAGERD